VLAKLAQGFGQIVYDETIVIGEMLVAHLRNFPPRQVEVQPVYKRHVISESVDVKKKSWLQMKI
jgi:hypothetical protein